MNLSDNVSSVRELFQKSLGLLSFAMSPSRGNVCGTSFGLDLNSTSNHQDLNIAAGPANDHRRSLGQQQIF